MIVHLRPRKEHGRPRGLAALALLLLAGAASARDPEALPEPRIVGPRRGEARAEALRRNGGTARTEEAVAAALDWLARHQEPGGLWDADGFPERCEKGDRCEGIGKGQHGEEIPCPFDQAISALATLAFLGHGHLPDAEDDPHGKAVAKALGALGAAGDRWALALSTQAFAEAEAMERKGRWRQAAHRGAQALLDLRQGDGAWGYAAPWRKGSDVPYTALVVQALVAARDAGFALPEDLGARVDAFLDSLEVDKGRVAYLLEGRKYGYTPTTSNAHCAAAIRLLLETGTDGENHKAHLALVGRTKPLWKISFREVTVRGRKERIQIGHLSMYQWWYGTIASFQAGGSTWSGWNGKLKTALTKHQRTEGCARGSWDPAGTYERMTGGRVFATALGALMLEAPYRQRRLSR